MQHDELASQSRMEGWHYVQVPLVSSVAKAVAIATVTRLNLLLALLTTTTQLQLCQRHSSVTAAVMRTSQACHV